MAVIVVIVPDGARPVKAGLQGGANVTIVGDANPGLAG